MLIGLFGGCFLLAYCLSKGGVKKLFKRDANEKGSYGMNYKPETYELQLEAILDPDEVGLLNRLDRERVNLVNKVTESVVCISTEGLQRRRFQNRGVVGEQITAVKDVGSGVIVSKQGHIVTNHHVIDDKSRLVITLHDGNEYEAKLIGTDPSLDVAVLKIISKDQKFSPIPFGDSEEVQVGQSVFAVGNPFGLGETVTQGIISARERSFSDQQKDLFQTDAAINPGNSGGPLVNVSGEIIGVNVAIFSSNSEQPESQGVGFSIPSNDVLRTFQQIAERGRPVRGYLGVKLMDLTPEVKVFLDYKGEGVAVTEVTKGSPAEQAGLRPRDVIIKFNSEEVKGRKHLIHLIQASDIDSEIKITLSRESEPLTLVANVLDSADLKGGMKETIIDSQYSEVMGRLASIGLRVRDLEWIEKRRGGDTGVIVYSIQPGSMASKTGLRKGDRVISMNGTPLISTEKSSATERFYKYIKDAKAGEAMTMVVRRNNTSARIQFRLW